jgi:hypothetical protein
MLLHSPDNRSLGSLIILQRFDVLLQQVDLLRQLPSMLYDIGEFLDQLHAIGHQAFYCPVPSSLSSQPFSVDSVSLNFACPISWRVLLFPPPLSLPLPPPSLPPILVVTTCTSLQPLTT